MPRTETFRSGQNLASPHGHEAYPGILVVKVNDAWDWILVVADGQGFTALGGESVPGYVFADGTKAESFGLEPGDRATKLRSDLPHFLSEWKVERAD